MEKLDQLVLSNLRKVSLCEVRLMDHQSDYSLLDIHAFFPLLMVLMYSDFLFFLLVAAANQT